MNQKDVPCTNDPCGIHRGRAAFHDLRIGLDGRLLVQPSPGRAAEGIRVAVAVHFIREVKELTVDFEKQTGLQVEATISSSGNLYARIVNGATYDILLSADKERPGP